MWSERGSVLIQVLFMSILGLVVSGMLLSGLYFQARSMQQVEEAPQAFYAVESGVNHSIQQLVNAVSEEDGVIEQFTVLAALWNREEPFTGAVGQVEYKARVVDVSPNLAFRAFVQKYADVTIEAEARPTGMRAQQVRATYRLRLGQLGSDRQRATRLLWQRG